MSLRPALHSLVSAALLAFLLPALAVAQSTSSGGTKIGVVDTQQVLSQSRAGKQIQVELEQQKQQLQVNLEAQQKALVDLRQRISDGASSMPQDQLDERKRELEQKATELRRAQEDATRTFTKLSEEKLREIEAKVMPAIQKIGKEMGYTAIFRKYDSGMVYADESSDITALVIQRMDAAQ